MARRGRIKHLLLLRCQRSVERLGRFASFVHCRRHVGRMLGVQGLHLVDPLWRWQLGYFGEIRTLSLQVDRRLHGRSESCPGSFLGRRQFERCFQCCMTPLHPGLHPCRIHRTHARVTHAFMHGTASAHHSSRPRTGRLRKGSKADGSQGSSKHQGFENRFHLSFLMFK